MTPAQHVRLAVALIVVALSHARGADAAALRPALAPPVRPSHADDAASRGAARLQDVPARAWPRDPNAVVRAVLSEPAYRVAPASSNVERTTWWDRAWAWLVRAAQRLVGPVGAAFGSGRAAGTLAGLALLAAALGALAVGLFRLAIAFVRPRGARTTAATATLATERSAAGWREVAAEAARRGDYAAAIGALFRAALAALDAHGVVPFDAARTPGEYRRMVRAARRAVAPTFDDLAERFVRAAYAAGEPGQSDYDGALHALARLEPLLA